MYIIVYVAAVATMLFFSGTVHYVRRWNLHRRRQKKVDIGRVQSGDTFLKNYERYLSGTMTYEELHNLKDKK